jgi:precorrin-6B methylase 1
LTVGSLIVVGSGIRLAQQCTPEARAAIAFADIVYAVMSDTLGLSWLKSVNINVVSLQGFYGEQRNRGDTYDQMRDAIVDAVRAGKKVCAVFYGHPGIFVTPSHEAVRDVRALGLSAVMLPGISAEDCLCADLCVDPGQTGSQSYEATDFIIHARQIDTTAALILWQIGVVGEFTGAFEPDARRLALLSEILRESYPAHHIVIVYEAATLPLMKAKVARLALSELACAEVSQASTLYVPPLAPPQKSAARVALLKQRLG